MLPIFLDAASVAFRLFNIAYVLTHWKERSQQKSQKALPTLAARSAEPFCLLCKNAIPGTSKGALRKKARLAADTGTALEARTAVLASSKNCVDESSEEIPKTGTPSDILRKW